MIHKVWANDKRFKSVEFSAGLNVILAERTVESGQKDTRNGAGKTTLLNIVHFCLGADLHRLSLPKDELQDWEFYIRLDLCGTTLTAKRSISNAKIIEILGDTSNFPIASEKDSEGAVFYKNDDWKNLLGKCLFKIQDGSVGKVRAFL